jgi:hypothetical protein
MRRRNAVHLRVEQRVFANQDQHMRAACGIEQILVEVCDNDDRIAAEDPPWIRSHRLGEGSRQDVGVDLRDEDAKGRQGGSAK